jgi:hypothetical protein
MERCRELEAEIAWSRTHAEALFRTVLRESSPPPYNALPCTGSSFNASEVMSFREPLPEGCPPADAPLIASAIMVYRLVRTAPPTEADFRSQRAEHPDKYFSNECLARGLSVHASRRDSEMAAKLPTLKGKQPCAVRLMPDSGHLKQTGKPSHHTWWPFASFDILSNIGEVAA